MAGEIPPPPPADALELMVPGRVCLAGEHSDWAGGFRRFNSSIVEGVCLVCGTEEGLFARVQKHPSKLVVYAKTDDGKPREPFVCNMEQRELKKVAEEGGFYSYMAGVAYQILIRNQVSGLIIDNYKTTLPVRKGLSSSAAVCVLVARAFNRVYDLRMTVRGEMEMAYQGEITTPSRCGKMDQCCAFGQVPVQMIFDGDAVACEEIIIKKPFLFVIVDLCAAKDTMVILSQLSRGFPKAATDVEKGVQEFLGPINKQFMQRARAALEAGDPEALGKVYNEFQDLFDKYLIPACPSELTAPVLHRCLNYPSLQQHIWGRKGVGSQGDGTAQFLCKSEEDREELIKKIEGELKMQCLRVTLGKKRRVRKAVIPCAGYTPEMYPATKVAKSPLLPILDHDGLLKPAILLLVQEALSAGVDEVILVVQEGDIDDFHRLFKEEIPLQNFNQLSPLQQKLGKEILEIGKHVILVTQPSQKGLADAVLCTRTAVADEPFLLLLGDNLYKSAIEGVPCGRQVADRFSGQSVIALREAHESEVHKYGTVGGVWSQDLLDVHAIEEKPSVKYAKEHLAVPGLAEDKYLCFFGFSILTSRIFEILQRNPSAHFTQALDELRQEQGIAGVVVKGTRFDIGEPLKYFAAANAIAARM